VDESNEPLVSIIMPCRNEAAYIEACLRSVLAQEDPPGGGIEVLVADGLSTDGTRELIRAVAEVDPRVRMIDNPGRIVPTGLNAAIRLARGEIIIRMDAHTEYAPDYVRRCVEVLEETGADNVGGPARTRGEGYLQRAFNACYHSPFSVGGARFHDPEYEGELDTVFYGCWRKTTLLRLGLFDEELVRNQDDELNLRLSLAGGRLWQSPRIRCWYHPRSSLIALARQYFQYGYWKVRVIQKHGRPASVRHLVPVAFVLFIALGWVGGLAHPAFWLAYLGVLATYVLIGLVYSCRAARADWALLPALPLVFSVYHLSYGAGFAGGVFDFVLWRAVTRAGPSGETLDPSNPQTLRSST
jgi:succinoglycan biosynthesis protein ExoA